MSLAIIADLARSVNDQTAAMAPMITKHDPRITPFSLSTYGNERTPEPMAQAERAKIEPLTDPFSIFPKALSKKFLLCG